MKDGRKERGNKTNKKKCTKGIIEVKRNGRKKARDKGKREENKQAKGRKNK